MIFIILAIILLLILLNNNTNIESYTPKIKVYFFYASWCGHCQQFKPEWNKFKNMVKSDNIIIQEINDCENKELCTSYGIEGFPTIIIEKNGKPNKYTGNRTAKDLYNALK